MSAGKRFWLWGPVTLYTAFIFWLSSAPRPLPAGLQWPGADKLLHLGEYTPLGLLLLRAISRSWPDRRWRRPIVLAVAAGLLVAAADELYQNFVITRVPSLLDWVADGAGVWLGQLLYGCSVARTP